MQFASTQMIDRLLQTKRHIYIPSQHVLSSIIYNRGAKVLRLFHTINTVICRQLSLNQLKTMNPEHAALTLLGEQRATSVTGAGTRLQC